MEKSDWKVINWPDTEWVGDFCASVKCPDCGKFIYVDSEEPKICDCGSEYIFRVTLEKRECKK